MPGYGLSRGGVTSLVELPPSPVGASAERGVQHLYSLQERAIHLQSRSFASILPTGRCGGRQDVSPVGTAPLEGNLPGVFELMMPWPREVVTIR